MLVKSFAAAVHGVNAILVTIEVNVTPGVRMMMVGLPDNAVKESYERIVSALGYCGIKYPKKQVIINLAPADIRKEGSAYDLPIAIGVLAANEDIPAEKLGKYLMMGELSLDGGINPVRGILPIAIMARELGFEGLVVPKGNAREAAVVDTLKVYGVDNIAQVIAFFKGNDVLKQEVVDTRKEFFDAQDCFELDFSDVKGQENVKRAFEIAAAGGHNLILVGPPGAGKSMMAKRLPSILPPLTLLEALETTKIHSVAGKVKKGVSLMTQRPFRSPHHTISPVALVGGGTFPQPGEISLAHNGVLFLDELPEFNRTVLEVMRQPLEDRTISISRAKYAVDYPASLMLIASMNPCPCGYYNHPDKACSCPPGAVQKYLNRVSGPLLDRIDIQIEITPVPFERISDRRLAEPSDEIRKRVVRAREMQAERFKETKGVYCNAQMNSKQLNCYAAPSEESLVVLKRAMDQFNLSARAYDRILKVARTIADLADSQDVEAKHIKEAVNYRNLDRESWANNG